MHYEACKKYLDGENEGWFMLNRACYHSNDIVRKAALQELESFVHKFPQYVKNARSLLYCICNDSTPEICEKAFQLYIKIWPINSEGRFRISHFIDIEKGIQPQSYCYPISDVCIKLIGTRFEALAVKAIVESTAVSVGEHNDRILEYFEKTPLKTLLDLSAGFKQENAFKLLVPRFLRSLVVMDRSDETQQILSIVDANGTVELEATQNEGIQIARSVQNILERGCPNLWNVLREHAAVID